MQESKDFHKMSHIINEISELRLQTAKLELILNEFYSSESSNERKRQIENELENLRGDVAQFFDFMIYDIENIGNKFVWFFKISCLEVSYLLKGKISIISKIINLGDRKSF